MSNSVVLYGSDGRVSIPVGTADWMTFEGTPTYERGDLLLGFTQKGHPVGYRDDRHVLVAAGTRSGKGTSFLVTNILNWWGSMFVNDPKGENAILTARNSANGSKWSQAKRIPTGVYDPYRVVRTQWDNFDDLRVTFNPLDLIREDDPESIDLAKMMVQAIEDTEKDDPFFEPSSRMAIRDLILHVASDPAYAGRRNLPTVCKLLKAGDEEGAALAELNRRSVSEQVPSGMTLLFEQMRANQAFGGHVSRSGTALAELQQQSARTLMSIIQTAAKQMDFLSSPIIAASLEKSSFSLSDFKTNPKGFRFYFCLPQRFAEVQYPLLRLFTVLTLTEMERHRPQPACGLPVLMILDEFHLMGRMRAIENAAAQIAGCGVKLVLVVQNLGQLRKLYGEAWEILVSACGVKLFFGNDDHFTREYASKLIGDVETSRETKNRSHSRSSSNGSTSGTSVSATESFSTGSSTSWGPQGYSSSSSSTRGWNVTSSRSESHSTSQSESSTYGTGESVMKRPLITPDEVGRFFGDPANPRVLALVSGHQPLALMRRNYYSDSRWVERYDPHPDHPIPPTIRAREAARQKRNMDAAIEAICVEMKASFDSAARREEETRRRLAAEAARAKRQSEAELAAYLAERQRRRNRLNLAIVSVVTLTLTLAVAGGVHWINGMAAVAGIR